MVFKHAFRGVMTLGTVLAWDGGCKLAVPDLPSNKCDCNANPTVSNLVGCKGDIPVYFDDLNDMPNGACILFVDGKTSGTSISNC